MDALMQAEGLEPANERMYASCRFMAAVTADSLRMTADTEWGA